MGGVVHVPRRDEQTGKQKREGACEEERMRKWEERMYGGGSSGANWWYMTVYAKKNATNMAALISMAYCAPCLSLCVHCTFTLSLKVRRLVKCRNPWIAALFPNCGTLAKIAVHLAKIAAIHFLHKSKGKPKNSPFLIKKCHTIFKFLFLFFIFL